MEVAQDHVLRRIFVSATFSAYSSHSKKEWLEEVTSQCESPRAVQLRHTKAPWPTGSLSVAHDGRVI